MDWEERELGGERNARDEAEDRLNEDWKGRGFGGKIRGRRRERLGTEQEEDKTEKGNRGERGKGGETT